MTTIKDVARLANVSTATVSHVINESRFVSEETKKRVLKAMEELKYIPNSVARSLKSQKTKTIGLLIPILDDETSNVFFMRVAQGIEYTLRKKGFYLMLNNTNENLEYELEQIENLTMKKIDGLIIAPPEGDHSSVDQLINNQYPVVFIDRKPKGIKRDIILNDGFTGSYNIVKMLIEKGHRNIGMLSGLLNLSPAQDRLNGYKKVMSDFGLKVKESWIIEGNSDFETGYRLTQKILTENPELTALFIASNAISLGAVGYLQDRGVEIPKDLAVVGFDNYEWTKVSAPPLTVVSQSSFELGVKAAEVLLKKIDNPNQPYEEYLLPTKIILRNSL